MEEIKALSQEGGGDKGTESGGWKMYRHRVRRVELEMKVTEKSEAMGLLHLLEKTGLGFDTRLSALPHSVRVIIYYGVTFSDEK